MNKKIMSTGLFWLWLTLVVLALDIGSKQLVIKFFWLGESVPVIPFMNFTYVHNAGGIFSLLANEGGWQRWAFSASTVIIVLVLLAIMYHSDKQKNLPNTTYATIIGGALGNLFDRIVHGVVIDFIDLHIGDWHWPTFNIADAGICISTILIMLDEFCGLTAKQKR
ncbi:signal peptidase II [Sodalis endosymbiont of Henestaris halophilus]|uniref:signal peptidase II n=1 Tax=Sodalis endosymbiont of Henestaris halophilus TaxID=1929246 RepID=UPI000BC04DCB|nr:signal peptidase II [Sodalis endosymbiont of Henestaris halophilus]SNC58566.1 Lipoprotein signal peptidase [Sodalis endosymbiont of Henestaris halophilus]